MLGDLAVRSVVATSVPAGDPSALSHRSIELLAGHGIQAAAGFGLVTLSGIFIRSGGLDPSRIKHRERLATW
jgi:hypothetical protein